MDVVVICLAGLCAGLLLIPSPSVPQVSLEDMVAAFWSSTEAGRKLAADLAKPFPKEAGHPQALEKRRVGAEPQAQPGHNRGTTVALEPTTAGMRAGGS